jgi:hypothetical protein
LHTCDAPNPARKGALHTFKTIKQPQTKEYQR